MSKMRDKKEADALTAELLEMKGELRNRKITESTFKRKAKDLLEGRTTNTRTQNQKIIKDLVQIAKAERDLPDRLNVS